MKFIFRWHMQNNAEPAPKPAAGMRSLSLHISPVAAAAEHYVREQLSRKRAKTLKR